MPVFREGTPEEQAFWEANAAYRVVPSRTQLANAFGVHPSKLTVNIIRQRMSQFGIRPDEFMVRKANATAAAGLIEIRVAGPEVMAIIKLSGLLNG